MRRLALFSTEFLIAYQQVELHTKVLNQRDFFLDEFLRGVELLLGGNRKL